jgi:hypothetical protein
VYEQQARRSEERATVLREILVVADDVSSQSPELEKTAAVAPAGEA